MIDRFGKRVAVSWSEVEMIWLEAAMSLETRAERKEAYRDISAMSGRPVLSIERMAWRVAMLKRDEAIRRMREQPRQVKRTEAMAPSQIKPSLAMMMAGRSTYSPTTGMR